MAEAVSDVLAGRGRRHLAVAAGTGTGKSLGYLVPAVLSDKRVIVATATKGLQDQLATKDLPLVAAGLDQKVTWAVLKGRSNYLCRQRLAEIEHFGEQERLDLGGVAAPKPRRGRAAVGRAATSETPGEQVARLVRWSGETDSGDRADLDFEPLPAAWSSVSVSGEECPGAHRCPSGGDCFAEKAHARAAQSQVVVVNHHLLGAHLRSEGAVLPEHDALVVDEAHEARGHSRREPRCGRGAGEGARDRGRRPECARGCRGEVDHSGGRRARQRRPSRARPLGDAGGPPADRARAGAGRRSERARLAASTARVAVAELRLGCRLGCRRRQRARARGRATGPPVAARCRAVQGGAGAVPGGGRGHGRLGGWRRPPDAALGAPRHPRPAG